MPRGRASRSSAQEGQGSGAQVRPATAGVLIVAFVAGALIAIIVLAVAVPLDGLAVPTPLCEGEIAVLSAIFLVYVALNRRTKDALGRSDSPISRLMRVRVQVPWPARVAGLALLVVGSFVFAFWAAADVVGGYNGYNYVFFYYPTFPQIYNHTIGLIPYVTSLDKGTQSTFFMGLAVFGLVLFLLNRGVGAALKDATTLFVAPALVVFELALWSQAPEDMTWHVTDFLWVGGIADGGIRQRDFVLLPFHNYPPVPGGHFVGSYASGPYVFSNWFILAVALLLVASRIPWMSLRSTLFRQGSADGLSDVTAAPGSQGLPRRRWLEVPRVGLSALWALLSRRHSGFCGLIRLDESAKADHYSRKLMAPFRDLPG